MKKAIFIPVAIVLLILLAFATTNAYRVPTYEHSFVEERPENVETVTLTVQGMKCRGMSMTCVSQIEDVDGVVSFTSYARTRTAIIEYDPTKTDVETLKAEICADIEQDGKVYSDIFTIE
jgi:copper chaperone CopZ